MSGRSLVLLALLSLAACGASRPPWAEGREVTTVQPRGAAPQRLADFEARLLALHNRDRARVGTPPLSWDPALAAGAAAYGAVLAERGRLAHSPPEARPGQGENLWMGTRGAYQVEEMIGHWAAEKALFRPGNFPDVSSSGHWADVGHYTQMIWAGARRVGCALRRSSTSDFLVCRYAPAGNVIGQRVP